MSELQQTRLLWRSGKLTRSDPKARYKFFDLPSETRLRIYKILLIHDDTIKIEYVADRPHMNKVGAKVELSTQLLSCSKGVLREARPILYGLNTFNIGPRGGLGHCLARLPKANWIHMKKFCGLEWRAISKRRIAELRRLENLEQLEIVFIYPQVLFVWGTVHHVPVGILEEETRKHITSITDDLKGLIMALPEVKIRCQLINHTYWPYNIACLDFVPNPDDPTGFLLEFVRYDLPEV